MNDQILLYLIYNLRKETIQPVVCGSKFGKKEVVPSPRGIINLSSATSLPGKWLLMMTKLALCHGPRVTR